jgi:hypothetical protein
MNRNKFIFLAGLHRSGTSLLHEIIRGHPEISGMSGTGAPEDEGQHLQSVYEPASSFGGPGKFVFDPRSHMDESHSLATQENAKIIFKHWSQYFDLSCKYLVEKSPPNIVRTRFLQKLFPGSKFILILRHPLAVSYATRKWSKTSIHSLFEHYLLAHEIMERDIQVLGSAYILRYEDLVTEPQEVINDIFSYLELEHIKISHDVKRGVNDRYFKMWESDRQNSGKQNLKELSQEFETETNKFGYSITDYSRLLPVSWIGNQL